MTHLRNILPESVFKMNMILAEKCVTICPFGEWLVNRVNKKGDWYYWGKNRDILDVFEQLKQPLSFS